MFQSDPWIPCLDVFCCLFIFYYTLKHLLPIEEYLKVMLVCGSDLLESFGIPGFWIPEQVC